MNKPTYVQEYKAIVDVLTSTPTQNISNGSAVKS